MCRYSSVVQPGAECRFALAASTRTSEDANESMSMAAAAAVREVSAADAAEAAQQLEPVLTPKQGRAAGGDLAKAAAAAQAAIHFSARKQEVGSAAEATPHSEALSGNSSDSDAVAGAAPRRILYRAISQHG